MRVAMERYLVADKSLGLFPAGRAIFVEIGDQYGLNNIRDGQIVIYNADTGVSVGAGITAQTVPNIVIAQGIDTDGDGMADVLRKAPFAKINACGLNAVTAEPPTPGQIKIVDVGIGCVSRGESYSLTVEARTEQTERLYNYRDYERFTETVNFQYDDCKDCDQPLDCKQVACALANKFNAKDGKSSVIKNGGLTRRIRQHQAKDKPFHVYVLHANDYEFCFTTTDVACKGCTQISAITGVTIDGVTTNFQFTTDPADATKTLVGQVNKIVTTINQLLGDKGHALDASTFVGTGKPCSDGVKILVNACVPVVLLGAAAAPIAPCATGLPTHTVNVQGECGGCDTATTITPCAYLRIVPKPIKLDKFCDRPDSWQKTLYTDIRVASSYEHNNFGFFREFVKQDYIIPRGLVYEAIHKVTMQDTSWNEPFSWGHDEFTGRYNNFFPGSRTPAMGKGLFNGCDSFDTVCIYNFEYDGHTLDTSTFANTSKPHQRLVVLVPNANTAFKTEFEGVINPWITSAAHCKVLKTVTCSVDQDQIERVLNPDTTVLTEGYPNTNGTVLGG